MVKLSGIIEAPKDVYSVSVRDYSISYPDYIVKKHKTVIKKFKSRREAEKFRDKMFNKYGWSAEIKIK